MSIDLEAIETRLAAAIPADDWLHMDGECVPVGVDMDAVRDVEDGDAAPYVEAHLDLIRHAPTDLAALVAEVERLGRAAEHQEAEKARLVEVARERGADNERLRAVADAARELEAWDSGEFTPKSPRELREAIFAALDAWRAGGEG